MKKKEIEKRFNTIISNSVPDVLDSILAKCKNEKGFENKVNIMKKEKNIEIKNKFFIPKLAGALALVTLFVGGILGVNSYNKVYKTDSIINFDVNPSIELKINKNEKIIKVIPLNDDGKTVIADMDLEKVDLDVGVNAIIGSMLKNGYITDIENSILVSVKNNDIEKAKKLEKEISDDINEILSASSIDGSILSQSYNNDSDAEKLANVNKVSEGKALLINKILNSNIKDSKGNAYTFESLVNLSINELNLLLASKEANIENTTTTGSASDSAYIGKEKAKKIAFNDAGVSSSKVTNLEVELDADDGRLVYEVDFKSNGTEYEYEINAKTGKIIDKDTEKDDDYVTNNNSSSTTTQNNNNSYIGKTKAKQIAFSNAGVASSKVKDLEVELDKENGIYVYEVSFEANNTEYDYKINAKTGKIINKEIEKNDDDDDHYDD